MRGFLQVKAVVSLRRLHFSEIVILSVSEGSMHYARSIGCIATHHARGVITFRGPGFSRGPETREAASAFAGVI
jgi:hypothetical protein